MATYAVLWVASSGLTVINELESAPIAQEPESQHASEGVCLSERLWVRFAKRRLRINSTHGAEMSCLALYFLSLEIRAFFAVDVLYSSL